MGMKTKAAQTDKNEPAPGYLLSRHGANAEVPEHYGDVVSARVVSRHTCGRSHRAYPALATCMFRHAAWIRGDGPIALLTWCGVVRVDLHRDVVTAEAALEIVNASRCGSRCTGDHELVRLDLGSVAP